MMTQAQLKQLFSKNNLSEYWTFFEPILKSTIRLETTKIDESAIPIGQSKIGGSPDLPSDISWFDDNGYPLSFVAQINCSEASTTDLEKRLPSHGILYFFFDQNQEAWGYIPEHKNGFKVFYSAQEGHLERKTSPSLLSPENFFGTYKIEFQPEISLPYWEYDFLVKNLPPDILQIYSSMAFQLRKERINKLLGHSDTLQYPMESTCEWVSLGHKEAEMSKIDANALNDTLKNKMDWTLLLQIDSNTDIGMLWGDMGKLYFWIKKDDLAQQKFENSWVILQC
jgi:uncharacterized protein YwqG